MADGDTPIEKKDTPRKNYAMRKIACYAGAGALLVSYAAGCVTGWYVRKYNVDTAVMAGVERTAEEIRKNIGREQGVQKKDLDTRVEHEKTAPVGLMPAEPE